MRQRTIRIFFSILVALILGWPSIVAADRVDRLVRALKTEDNYKVRLQVALALGKLKNRRAVPALIQAMSDSNYMVRGIAAAALKQIGDRRALPALKKAAQKDKHSFVRSQASRAYQALKGTGKAPVGARFYVTVGKLTNKAKRGGSRLSQIFGDALLREFSKVSGVATDWGGGKPSAAALRKRRMKGFVLDGSILSLSQRRSGDSIEISCSIRVSLATFPGNSMKAFYSGGASMEVSASSFRPEYEDSIYKEIVEGAAQGAKQHIVSSYLSSQ